MAKQQQQQAVCMVFLMVFIVLSAMHSVPVEAGGFVVPFFIFRLQLQLNYNCPYSHKKNYNCP
jgi:hypothetical protein